ncbi:MAG: flagellar filament capping protein FliD [Candidatus Zixiibacteriota bacterium]
MPGFNSIDGIASNLNTTEIVEAIINSERGHIRLMAAQQSSRTDQMTVYNSVSALLIGLKTKAAQLAQPATFDKMKISISDDSYISAAVSSKVAAGSYRLSIQQLARNHQVASQGFADSGSTSIGTGTFKIQRGDSSATTIIIDSTNDTLEGLRQAINASGAGVTASIINDGSENDPYRLLLTSEKTGLSGRISVTSQLSGGESPDFSGSSFDIPETLSWSAAATSSVSLGSSASYSGSANKQYTFTVAGTGVQTVGSGDLLIDWTDGTNSGTITVSAAATEVTLEGDGSDGLTVSFAAGDLVGGDTFQVQAFSPIVQEAMDAKVSLGTFSTTGSPIVITSATNTIEGLIGGVTLNLKKITDANTPEITITTEQDSAGIRSSIEDFIKQYNDAMSRISEFLKYNAETEQAGTLLGDTTLLSIDDQMRSMISTVVDGIDSGYRVLADIGIRSSALGELRVADSSKLDQAISEDLSDVLKLFTNWGNSSINKVTYLGGSSASKASGFDGYDVDITQVATHGYLTGTVINNPGDSPIVIGDNNNTIKLKVDGLVSEDIVLTNGTYNSFAELVAEIQDKIDADEKIGSRNVTVSYVDTGATGYLSIESSSYGSSSNVEIQAGSANSALTMLGLAQARVTEGLDVVGTINGEQATGSGQILTGNKGNGTTEGIRLKVELEAADLIDGTEANIVIAKGVASKFDDLLDSLTKATDGLLARRTRAVQSQVDLTTERIEHEEARLAIRKEALFKKYIEMERLLSSFNSQSAYLETQLSQISSNWNYGKNSN